MTLAPKRTDRPQVPVGWCDDPAGSGQKRYWDGNQWTGVPTSAPSTTETPTGFNWADAVQPLEARRRARVVASFAEYPAEDVLGHPERAPEARASLAEWCEGDAELLARARADVLRGTRGAQAAVAENNRRAAELLELVARA
jgi:hypothetical protein